MRLPLSWLLEYAAIDLAPDDDEGVQEMSRRLTACGLEVESLEPVGQDITGVVVAEVLDIEELTGFNKPIRYCQVSTGDGQERHVICGASNFAVGDRVALAVPGAVLPGGFEIGARKTYGRISEGMICSAAELAIGDDHSGIMVLPAGRAARHRLRQLRRPARRRVRHQRHAGQGIRAVRARRGQGAGDLLPGAVHRSSRRRPAGRRRRRVAGCLPGQHRGRHRLRPVRGARGARASTRRHRRRWP